MSGSKAVLSSLILAAGLAAAPFATLAADPAIAQGERVFRTQCAGCHSIEPDDHRAGPSLHGVIGRSAGTVVGFDYSPALRAAELVWTDETLDAFLGDPKSVVPDTWMIFWGVRQPARGQLIRFLEHVAE